MLWVLKQVQNDRHRFFCTLSTFFLTFVRNSKYRTECRNWIIDISNSDSRLFLMLIYHISPFGDFQLKNKFPWTPCALRRGILVRVEGRGNPSIRQEISSTLFVCYRQTTADAGHFNATYRFAHQGADDTERHKGFVAGTAVGLSSQQYIPYFLAQLDWHRNAYENLRCVGTQLLWGYKSLV